MRFVFIPLALHNNPQYITHFFLHVLTEVIMAGCLMLRVQECLVLKHYSLEVGKNPTRQETHQIDKNNVYCLFLVAILEY